MLMQAGHLYEATCLGPNIEKHASAPLYPELSTHQHTDYHTMKNLVITDIDGEINHLRLKYLKQHPEYDPYNDHWLNHIKVADIKCNCSHKIAYEKILGLEDPDQKQEVMMFNNCKHALFAAAKRQMKMAPKPTEEDAKEFVEYAINVIEKEVGDELNKFGYSYQQWYEHNNKAKQNDIDKYFDSQNNPQNYTTKELKKLESTAYEGICKQELQDVNGKPRMVCSIPIKTKVTMGPVTWKLEEIMQDKLGGYCGGKNLEEMSDEVNKIVKQGFTKIVEGDGSGFDNTQDVSLKEVERYVYRRIRNKIYHVPQQQFEAISQQLYKVMDVIYINENGKKHKMMTYKILGSVFSGDCDTTLANTMRMALYNRFVNEKAGLKYGRDFLVWSKGDDFTVFYKPYISDEFIRKLYSKYFLNELPTIETYKGIGQILKFLTIGGPNSLSFCSLKAWYTDDQELDIILTRNPEKFFNISKYSRKIKKFTDIPRANYLIQQALALRKTYKGIQVFEIMAEAYEYAAAQVIQGISKTKREILNNINKTIDYVNKTQGKIRAKLQKLHEQYEDKNKILLYDIQRRNKSTKIWEDYWEAMKAVQEDFTYKLSPYQLAVINQQIADQIDMMHLKSSLGLKNRCLETTIIQQKLQQQILERLITTNIK
jgi:hypothetical protein